MRDVVVVIPCYREPIDEVAKSVSSALAVANVTRVIVVDDGAGDRAICKLAGGRDSGQEVTVLYRDENGGPAAALDDGIAHASDNSVICRLDVRDEFYADTKAEQIETVLSGSCRASASPHYDPVKGDVCVPGALWRRSIYTVSQFTQISTVFERSVWKEVGIDTSFRWAEDWRFNMLVEHYVGWDMFPGVTCSAGMFPGGYTDRGGPGRNADRKRVYELGQHLGRPNRYAHLYSEEWCAYRGIKPLKRKK